MNTNFPLHGSITYNVVEAAQQRLLKIGLTIRDIFTRNNVPYVIFYGTLLGAVRHKGFIPWDLDIDFAVFEEDYDKAYEVLCKELPDWLAMLDSKSDPNYFASWFKVADKYSEFHATTYKDDNDFRYRGLHVDVYKLTKTSINTYEEYKRDEALRFFTKKHEAGRLSDSDFNAHVVAVENTYQKNCEERTILDDDKPLYAFLHFLALEPDLFFPLRNDILFEGEHFLAPQNINEILSASYGKNYMTYPPFEERDLKMDSIVLYDIPNS